MTKSRYHIANFPSSSMKNPLAALSGHIFGRVGDIFELLKIYADESCEQSPQRILQNMIQENETIFGPTILDLIPCVSTSDQVQSSQESPLEESKKPSSVLETKATTCDSQEHVKFCEKDEIISSPAAVDKMDVNTTSDAAINISPKEQKSITETKGDVNVLIKNLAEIRSMLIIKESEDIRVEIDFDLPCTPEGISQDDPMQDSSPSKNTNSPGRAERKSASPSISPSKSMQSSDGLSVSSESSITVTYSDPNILNFLAKRLLSILSSRKKYIEQIHSCFDKFPRDMRDFNNTINNLKFVVENLPMANEAYLTDELLKLRNDLINKAHKMSEKILLLLEDVEKDVDVFEKCLKEIDDMEKEQEPLLSTNGEPLLTVGDLKTLELRLNKICKDADCAVILKDGRKTMLLNSSSDFEWLVKHFVKFLIVTKILRPDLMDGSLVGKDE